MVTSDERIKILKMLEEGKISSEEAARLLKTLSQSKTDRPSQNSKRDPRWLRVRVTDIKRNKTSVNVNLPVELVNVGLRLGARFIPEVEGVDLEELYQAMRDGLTGKIVDVVDEVENQRVEIYVE
jgi:hypothetical protein